MDKNFDVFVDSLLMSFSNDSIDQLFGRQLASNFRKIHAQSALESTAMRCSMIRRTNVIANQSKGGGLTTDKREINT